MAKNKRTERSTVRCYPSEAETLEEGAERIGLPLATYIRIKALEGARQDLRNLDADRAGQRHPQTA